MNLRRVVARNVVWNWAGMAVNILAGLVVMPFLVLQLGRTSYGLWILIGSLTGYFGLLDLGVRGSIGRYIAFHRARKDQDNVNATASTALALLCLPALLTFAGTVGMVLLFFQLFGAQVPAGEVDAVRLALLLTGVNIALTFPLSVFGAKLWASQRFDVLNAVDIPITLLRTGLTFALVGGGHELVTLALIVLACNLARSLATAFFSFRLDRAFRLGPRLVRRSVAGQLFGYGFWYLLLDVADLYIAQISIIVIGARLSVKLVTTYSIALRLMDTARAFLVSSTGVLTPIATAFHAEEKHDQQRQLFVEGGKYCLAVALFFAAWFVFLGKALIFLWIGHSVPAAQVDLAWQLLAILAVGQVLPMSQWVTHSMILGMGRHRVLACVSLAEAGAATALAFVLAGPYGIYGVCAAFITGEMVCRGGIKLVYACHVVRVPLHRYLTQAVLLPVAAAALPILALALLSRWWAAASWMELILHTGAFTLLYAASCVLLLIGWERVRMTVGGVFGGVKRPGRRGDEVPLSHDNRGFEDSAPATQVECGPRVASPVEREACAVPGGGEPS